MKKITFKRYLFVLVATALLSSCMAGGSGFSPIEGTGPNKEPIILRYTSFMLDSSESGQVYFDTISEFEAQNPDIRIETDYLQNSYYTAGVKSRLLGGEKIDVFDIWSKSQFEEFRKLGTSVYLDLSGSSFLEDFLPSSLEAVTIDGKVYGIPGVMHTDGLLYNKTLFDQMKLQVPESWDEFIELCEVIKNHGVIPIALSSEWWVPQFFFGSQMSNNGADATWTADLEKGDWKVNHPFVVDAMLKTKEMIDRGYVPRDWTTLKHEHSRNMISSGEAAMIITGTWDLPTVLARSGEQEIGFMMVPGTKQTVPNLNIGSYKVISSTTENPEEAKRFLAFMNGRAIQEKLAMGVLAVPSVKDSKVEHPVVKKLAELVTRKDAAIYWPHTVSTETLQVRLLELINEYLAGADLEKTLEEMQKAIDHTRE